MLGIFKTKCYLDTLGRFTCIQHQHQHKQQQQQQTNWNSSTNHTVQLSTHFTCSLSISNCSLELDFGVQHRKKKKLSRLSQWNARVTLLGHLPFTDSNTRFIYERKHRRHKHRNSLVGVIVCCAIVCCCILIYCINRAHICTFSVYHPRKSCDFCFLSPFLIYDRIDEATLPWLSIVSFQSLRFYFM